jgi:hypothetical protein
MSAPTGQGVNADEAQQSKLEPGKLRHLCRGSSGALLSYGST